MRTRWTLRNRWTLSTALATLAVLVAFVLVAPARAVSDEPTDGPGRFALGLRTEPLASLDAATVAAPGELDAIERWNLSGAVPAKIGFSRTLTTPREVRLSAADLSRTTPFRLAGGVVTQDAKTAWSGAAPYGSPRPTRSASTWPRSTCPRAAGSGPTPAGSRRSRCRPRCSARSTGAPGAWTVDRHRLRRHDLAGGLHPASGPPARPAPVGFTIDRIGELVALDPTGRPLTGDDAPRDRTLVQKDDACYVDATCAEADYGEEIDRARDAVAHIVYESDDGGFFACTGTLVADADERRVEQRAFFLTANHCVSSQSEAESLYALLPVPHQELRRRPSGWANQIVGADLLKTIELTDTTLLELSDLPPNPTFVPFKAERQPYDTIVDVLGHPMSRPLSFSRHEVASGVPCDGDPWLATLDTLGCVGPGSSGSAALDQDGRLVGILRGACGDETTVTTFFGRFSISYPELAPILATRPAADFFTDPAYPDFAFLVEIDNGTEIRTGHREAACLPETVCVSGAIPGRSEVFLRIVGPKGNGFLWPTLVKFTTSRVLVTIRQISTGKEQMYELAGASPGVDELPGLFDRQGFLPMP